LGQVRFERYFTPRGIAMSKDKAKKAAAGVFAGLAALATAGQPNVQHVETLLQPERQSTKLSVTKEASERKPQPTKPSPFQVPMARPREERQGGDPKAILEEGDRLSEALKAELGQAEQHARDKSVDKVRMTILRDLVDRWAELAGELTDMMRRKDEQTDAIEQAKACVALMELMLRPPTGGSRAPFLFPFSP
jgi:hypothetical protein